MSLLAALVVVLAACDSTGTTPSTPAPTATPISATPATGTIAAVSVPPLDTPSGKVAATSITIGVANDPVRLDPAIVGDETSLMVSRQIYDTLYEYEAGSVQVNPSIIKFRAKDDFGKNGQQVIYSGVCRDANNDITKEGSDGKCFQLQLLPELRFSNGDPLDARAVALNFRRWRCLASPNLGSLAQAIASVDITQPSINQTPGQKIVVHLSQPRTTFDSDLARPQYAIINPAVWVEPGFAVSADVLKNPDTFAPLCPKDMLPPFGTTADSLDGAGSGPYMVKEWKAHDKLRLETNPIYLTADAQKTAVGRVVNPYSDLPIYKDRRPYTNTIIVKTLKANQTGVEEVAANRVQISPKMRVTDMGDAALTGSDGKAKIALRPALNVGIVAMNIGKAPFDKLEVRRAIWLALDRTALANNSMYHGQATPIGLFQPPNSLFYEYLSSDKANNVQRAITPNLTEARRLLAQGGYANGLTLTLYTAPDYQPYFPDTTKVFEALRDNLRQVGISLQRGDALDRIEFDRRRDRADQKDSLDFYLYGYQGSTGDPDEFFSAFFGAGRDGQNTDEYKIEKSGSIRSRIAAAAGNPDDNQRKLRDYFELNQLLSYEYQPYVPLVSANIPIAVRCEVHNFVPSPTRTESWNKLWLSSGCA